MEDMENKPRRKKRSKFSRRVRAFARHVVELPAQTLLVIGGSIAIVLIAVILLVVLLPKGQPRPENVPAVSEAPVSEATPTLPPFTPEPTPEPTPTPHPLVGVGTQGTNGWYLQLNNVAGVVAEIQTRLIELGYMAMPVVDGVEQVTTTYGPATRDAVRKFQAVNDMEIDGCVGEKTFDLLMSVSAKGMTIKRGIDPALIENDVTRLQNRLIALGYMSGSANGKYGDDTIKAVKQFQTDNSLAADGVAGPATLEKLYAEDTAAAGGAAQSTGTAAETQTAAPITP